MPLPSTGPADPAEQSLAIRAIRNALSPAQVVEFDREFRRVMSEATANFDLSGVLDFMRRWRRVVN